MANATTSDGRKYYIPHDSLWPIVGSVALFTMMLGAVSYLNDWGPGLVFLPGAALMAFMFFGWFRTVIGENQHGIYNLQVDRSLPHGNDVVHLLRGHVLRRLLRRAVLRARAVGAVAGRARA